MQITKSKQTKHSVELGVEPSEQELADIKRQVLSRLRPQVKASGFRPGKAPDSVVEKELGSDLVHKEFLDEALAQVFTRALQQEKLAILGQPTVNVQKFVPYTALLVTAEIELRPEVKLPDLKTIKVKVEPEKVTPKRIDEVLDNLARRAAERKSVTRAAKSDDEVRIDFKGKDAKGAPVPGATGDDMPVTLGSKTFIPGFEEELVGLKKGDTKTFTLTFPKDYQAQNLRGAMVTFDVTVKDVLEVVPPELTDAFASKASPFTTIKELREDVAKQLEEEYARQAAKAEREQIVEAVMSKVKLDVPPKFTGRVLEEVRQDFLSSLSQRGLDEESFYTQQKTDKETYTTAELRPAAEKRIKASLILGEVAKAENVTVPQEDLDAYVSFLREQYSKDEKALEQLDRPEVREDIAMQMLTERTIDKLVELVSSATSKI